jgi:hypothetical protein
MQIPFIELLQGILIGIVISIPLGPVGLIVMKRTAEFGLRAGILSGLAIVLSTALRPFLSLPVFITPYRFCTGFRCGRIFSVAASSFSMVCALR